MSHVESPLARFLAPVRGCLTPEVAARIAALRTDPATQAQLDDWAERNAEGQLTEGERAEYLASVQALSLVAVLQANARAVIAEAAHGRGDP